MNSLNNNTSDPTQSTASGNIFNDPVPDFSIQTRKNSKLSLESIVTTAKEEKYPSLIMNADEEEELKEVDVHQLNIPQKMELEDLLEVNVEHHDQDNENNPHQWLFSDGMHKLNDMKEKGKIKLKAFIGHIKKAPNFIVDNEYIQRGYRINFNSKKRICKSLFMCHNETVNVWSHLIGVGCFIGLLIYTIITLSPLASYFSISGSDPEREISVNQASFIIPHSDIGKYDNFEDLCSKFLNISINTQQIDEASAFNLWGKAWTNELDYESSYIDSVFGLVNGLPVQIKDQINVYIGNLTPQDSERSESTKAKIDYLKSMTDLITQKAYNWLNNIQDQIAKHQDATLGDWLVLGPIIQDPLSVKYYVSKMPLFLHIAGAISCLGCSTIFHLFKDQSKKTSEFLVRLDYAGIALMIAGSNMPPLYYSFYCKPMHVYRNLYMILQSVSCFLVFAASLWPKFDKAQYRVLRGVLFVILGLVAVAPFTHIFLVRDSELLPIFNPTLWIVGAVLYVGGAVIYMLRVPERWFPNKFDFCGSSHQIFHICIVIAALSHYYAALQCFHNRQYSPCPNEFIDNIE
eukprot:403335825